ncbi:MAG: leucine-rich repeat protein, partial [Oscillospiraceae bacterium]|nr:leucine-rich repeat protein [Oscillospiraceae bacterium]
AFSGKNLTAINVDEYNTEYKSIDGVVYEKDGRTLVTYPSGRQGAYTVPDGTVVIDNYAFSDCKGITEITLPETMITIMDYAFGHCTALTAVHIPASLQSIRSGVFTGCTSMEEITIAEGNTYFYTEDNMIITIKDNTLVYCPHTVSGTVTIPNNVKSIGGGVFENFEGITEVILPEGLTMISAAAFEGCINLESVTLPSTLIYLMHGAFNRCSSLTSVSIPEGVSNVNDYAFSNCSALTEVYLPASTRSIGWGAFYGCTSLETVVYAGTEDMWNEILIRDENTELQNAVINCIGNDSTSAPVTTGDVDGSGGIDASDAATLLQAAAAAGVSGESGLNAAQEASSDVNGDGKFDASDAALILQYAAYTGTGGTDSIEDYIANK